MPSISCVPMQFIIAVCAPCARHITPAPRCVHAPAGGIRGVRVQNTQRSKRVGRLRPGRKFDWMGSTETPAINQTFRLSLLQQDPGFAV